MKKFIIAMSFLLLFLAFVSESNAVCPPGGFTPGGYAKIQLSSTCYMEVEFCWRLWDYGGGHVDYDMWMGEIKFVGDCDYFRFDFENNPSNYLQRAWEYIAFVKNPWGAAPPPICPTQSMEYWRYGHASCYSSGWIVVWVPDNPTTGELGHFEWIKRPCNDIDENGRCWKRFKSCLYWDATCSCFKPRVTNVGSGGGNQNCGVGCTYICE